MKISINSKNQTHTKFCFSQNMHTAIFILTLPVFELKNWLKKEIEKNPLLTEKEKPLKTPVESLEFFPQQKTLTEHLSFQAHLNFKSKEQIQIATYIIGNLNDKGFLDVEISEIAKKINKSPAFVSKTLKIMQTFDPPGICARNIQESLLLQLKMQNKKNSVIYEIIKNHYQDFIKKNFKTISQKLKIPQEKISSKINQDVKNLSINPTISFQKEKSVPLIPDISITQNKNTWTIKLNNEDLPEFCIQESYMNISKDPSIQKFIKRYLSQGKWLLNILNQRNSLLVKLTSFIIEKQNQYLNGQKNLRPLTYKEAAKKLNVNVSTITRATQNKYIDTPLGIFPLKYFFSLQTSSEKIAQQTALDILKKIIEKENKKKPYSDIDLCKKMNSAGIKCARRTIAKYRKKLNILPSQSRNKGYLTK